MFQKPIELLGWIIVALFCFWFSAIIFTGNSCTRVYRSGWPAWYGFEFIEFTSQNWTEPSTKLSIFKYKIKSTIALQEFFQKTLYGDTIKCKL